MKQYLKSVLIFCSLLFTIHETRAQYQYMGTYNNEGVPNYLVNPRDTVSAGFRAMITATLPEFRKVPVYNPILIAPGRTETINVSCPSDVWISFIDEGASYRNALGFYTYNTDNPPTTAPPANQIKIIFPNASKPGYGGYLQPGDKVYLGNFPAKTGIGFVLMADGWNGTIVNPGNWTLYSNSAFNPEADSTLRKHTVIIRDTTTNRLVIGFEDVRRDNPNCDQDFNDLLFFATVTPIACVNKLDSIPDLTDDGRISFSGNTGGLESKSLGDKIAKRVFDKFMNGTNGDVDYSKMLTLKKEQNTIRSTATTQSGLSLADIMPSYMLDSGFVAYVSTPSDIMDITNAKEIRSVDFTENGICKAVAFATKTLSVMYDHTKPICDRLKGAELLSIDNFSLNELNFVRYTLKQENGNIEYSMSFSVGKKAGRNSFSFQSNWLNKDYVVEDTLINYQIWGTAPYFCVDMALQVLNKLNAIMPVEQFNSSKPLPKTYIVNGNRDGSYLNLSIENNTNNQTGYFEVEEKANETTTIKTKRTVPFTMKANGKSPVAFPMNDVFETTVYMYVGGQLQDVVYMSDGTWNINYDSTKTVLSKYQITNDTVIVSADEYPVFRNVAIEATTSTYITAYKVLRGAGALEDLSAHKTLSFSAKGGTNLRITLVKNSITDYNNQYKIVLPLSKEEKKYNISLADFRSNGFTENIKANDITTIVFTFETTDSKQTTVSGLLNEISFSKKSADYLTSLASAQIYVFPNPSTGGNFNASFRSSTNTNITLKITEAGTGRIVFTKNSNAIKGDNIIPVQLKTPASPGMYLISIEGAGLQLQTQKLIIN